MLQATVTFKSSTLAWLGRHERTRAPPCQGNKKPFTRLPRKALRPPAPPLGIARAGVVAVIRQ